MTVPNILIFQCNWSSDRGLDLSKSSNSNFPTNFRVIRVACTGNIDPIEFIQAFQNGTDGVLVVGCHPGKCHYEVGNLQAKYKVLLVKKLLQKIGMDDKRLRLEWISPSEKYKLSELLIDFNSQLLRLGNSPANPDEKIRKDLADLRELSSNFKLRWIISRARNLVDLENAYGEKFSHERIEQILDDFIDIELTRVRILASIENRGLTAAEIAKELQIPTVRVMSHLIKLSDEHKVNFNVENHIAVFTKVGGAET